MPDFWNKSTLEPKRQHRWTLNINGLSGVESYIVKKTDKPSFTINETEHSYFGHKFYYPGQVTWETITVTLVDPIDPDTSAALYNALAQSGYRPPLRDGGSNQLATVSKASSVAALGPTVTLKQFDANADGTNREVETWMLYNPWIKDVKFGDLDYESDGMVEITLTIRYDWATLA